MLTKRRFLLYVTLLSAFAATINYTRAQMPQLQDPENTLLMKLKDGEVYIVMRPDLAPKHVARIKELVRDKFYDGITFHRVIDKFMAQTGDPTGTGSGGSGKNIKAEFNDEPFVRGSLGMARAANPDSADSQFFICFDEANWLDGQYTNFGMVISGMQYVDNIKKGSPESGKVTDPDSIISLRIVSDQ